ncbi:MAG: DUF6655 family protein [Candidatus Eiseniibacteriota bacterium]
MKQLLPLLGIAALALAGCTTERETSPPRTATEQLLISTAADRAAQQVSLTVPKGAKLFVDSSNFEGTDAKYAIGALREQLLKGGGRLVAERKDADYVVEIRSGALSIDEDSILVGIPKMQIPIPLAGSFSFPEIALFKKEQRKGVAKFAAAGYGAKDGQFADASAPRYGFSHETEWVVLLFISWKTDDILPEDAREPIVDIMPAK